MSDEVKATKRSDASKVVARVLTELPECRALAGQLEAQLTRKGVSARQARRRIRWATTGPNPTVAKTMKGAEGTWYCLAGQAPARTSASSQQGSFLASLPAHVRCDVALAAHVLQEHGGCLNANDLGKLVAQRAERPVLWGVVAVEVAVTAAKPRALAYRRGAGLSPLVS